MFARIHTSPVPLALAAAVALTTLLGAAPAQAQRAQIWLSQQREPRGGTEASLLAWARRSNTNTLREVTDRELAERYWEANMVIKFSQPVGDLEFHVLFYDIDEGVRDFVVDMSTFVNDRTQTTFVQRIRLPRPQFKPNRRMELVVTIRQREVGTRRFELRGEEVRHTGEVSFSSEETGGRRAEQQQQQQAQEPEPVEDPALAEPTEQEHEMEATGVAVDQMENPFGNPDEMPDTAPQDGGCASCAVVSRREPVGALLGAALVAIALGFRRRRRR